MLVWITGDTVLHRPLREAAAAMQVDVALVHVGGVRFPITGPIRYTMTARQAVELVELVRPRVAVPVHYEGWAHFKDGRAAMERPWPPRRRTSPTASAGSRSAPLQTSRSALPWPLSPLSLRSPLTLRSPLPPPLPPSFTLRAT